MPDDDVPADMAEADRLVREACAKISEHVDAVRIFVSKKRTDGKGDGTWRMSLGSGNWYAQYGQIRQWLIKEEAADDGPMGNDD